MGGAPSGRGRALERGWLLVVVPGAGAEEWAGPERACAVHSTRRRRRRARGKMEDFQAAEEVTLGMGHGRVAAEIQVWRGPAWGAAATSAHGHAVAVPSGPLRGFPAWAVPAVGGAPGLAGAQVPRSEDDITPPRLRCCGPRPGPGWERRDPAVASMMTRARRASSRSLKWGSAVPAVRLPSADAQTEPAFVSVPHLVLQCDASSPPLGTFHFSLR